MNPLAKTIAIAIALLMSFNLMAQSNQLFKYKNQAQANSQEKSNLQEVVVNSDALLWNVINITLPDGEVIVLNKSMSGKNDDMPFWVGQTADKMTEASLVSDSNIITGTIRHRGKNYDITYTGGKNFIKPIPKPSVPTHADDYNDYIKNYLNGNGNGNGSELKNLHPETNSFVSGDFSTSADNRSLDILVAVTKASRDEIQNSSTSVQSFLDRQVNTLNQAFANSGVNIFAKISGIIDVDLDDNRDLRSDAALTKIRSSLPVASKRKSTSSDVVFLITKNLNECGRALSGFAKETAFAVGRLDCFSDLTFAHEITHLFGAQHNTEEDRSNFLVPYAHGFASQNKPNTNISCFDTIMAYHISCYTYSPTYGYRLNTYSSKINYFSNPNVAINGTPTGNTSRANVARFLNERASTVTAWGNNLDTPSDPGDGKLTEVDRMVWEATLLLLN